MTIQGGPGLKGGKGQRGPDGFPVSSIALRLRTVHLYMLLLNRDKLDQEDLWDQKGRK